MVRSEKLLVQARAISKAHSEPDWLIKFREESIGLFEKLPNENSALYKKYTNLDGIDLEKLKAEDGMQGRLSMNLNFLQKENANFIQKDSINTKLVHESGKGIVFTDMHFGIANHELQVLPFFKAELNSVEKNKFGSLTGGLFSNGYFLHVGKNTSIETPIRAINLLTTQNSHLATKNIIILEENASATIIVENYSQLEGSEISVLSANTQILLKKGARLNFASINCLDEKTVMFQNKHIEIGDDASANFSGGFLGGKLTISNQDSKMLGKNCQTQDFEVIFGAGKERYNISSNLYHIGKNTNGKVAVKGIFRDSSNGLFKGMADISQSAAGAKSYVASHSILLGRESSSDAIPGLQIKNNDVKATHSASVAQVDEAQMFYLMSRGFDKKAAEKTIVNGFVEPIIQQMLLPQIQKRLRSLIDLKWKDWGIEKLQREMENKEEEDFGAGNQGVGIFEGHYKYR